MTLLSWLKKLLGKKNNPELGGTRVFYGAKWVPKYIEKIEEAIRETIVEADVGDEWPENRNYVGKNADLLMKKIIPIAEDLAKDLRRDPTGDPNITLMLMLSVLSYSWHTFIMNAKGNCPERYGEESCNWILEMVDTLPEVYQEIREESIKYSRVYELDNPKWIDAMRRAAEAQYDVLADDIYTYRGLLTGDHGCKDPRWKECCMPPFLGAECRECGRKVAVHHTYTKGIFPKDLTRNQFQGWLDIVGNLNG